MIQEKKTMPVLDELAKKATELSKGSLKDTVVLHINHSMDNSFYFSEVLNEMFCRAVFVGAPYNDMAVGPEWSFIRYYGKNKKGSYELWEEDICFQKNMKDFTKAVELLIERAIRESLMPWLKEGKRLLIIEDGGYHYPVLHRLLEEYPWLEGQICGSVEQTASGTVRCRRFGEKYGFSYPCASISRSDIKMYVESRFIGHRVVEELANFLYEANTFLDYHHVLLLGYGIVGRQVAMDLKHYRCRTSVWEIDPLVESVAREDGFEVIGQWEPSWFEKDTILIGNTGTPAFTMEMLQCFFEGQSNLLYLASSSSQDWEFREFLSRLRGKETWPQGAALKGAVDNRYYTRYLFEYQGREKEVVLIAEGLPVNFYRKDAISLTYSIIDLIFAEMLSLGLAFHEYPQVEKKLWLMGEEDQLSPFFTEEELITLWFARYRLTGFSGADKILSGHPMGGHLRRKMSEEA